VARRRLATWAGVSATLLPGFLACRRPPAILRAGSLACTGPTLGVRHLPGIFFGSAAGADGPTADHGRVASEARAVDPPACFGAPEAECWRSLTGTHRALR
jgi:hypothetical protein